MYNDLNEEILILKEQTQCPKKHQCIKKMIMNLDLAKQYAKYYITQCMDTSESRVCSCSISFKIAKVCRCPLRELIALRYDEIGPSIRS